MEEGAVAEGLGGHSRVPMVEHGELGGEGGEHREHLRRERAHDVPRFVQARLLPVAQSAEVDDVVLEETGHRRLLAVGGGVEGRGHLVDEQVGVGLRIDRAEDLRVDVRVLLTRVRIGEAHNAVRVAPVDVRLHHRAVRGGVAVGAECETFEGLARRQRLGRVEVAEEVVKGAVLAHHYDHVIEAGLRAGRECGERIRVIGEAVPAAGSGDRGSDRRPSRAADNRSRQGGTAHGEESAPGGVAG